MKRLGLVGVGAWGQRYIDRIGVRADCTLVAVARASAGGAAAGPGGLPCEPWQSLVERAARGELDGLIAATTPAHQADIAAACASAGAPLLVEKPLGLSLAAVERVRECFARSPRKAPLQVDYIHLWAPAFVRLRRCIAEAGGASRAVAISSHGFKHGPLRGWSSLYDFAPHDLSMCLGLLGVEAAFSLREARLITADDEGHELYDVRFELGGVPVHMLAGNGGTTKARRFAVTLPGGREIVYDDTRPHPDKLVDRGAPVPIDESGALDAVLATFLESIERWTAGRLPAESAESGLVLSARVNAMLDQIDAASGRGAS